MTKIIQRHDTAANWTTVNPVLAVGEIGIETDTNKIKIGDGTSPYTELPYSDKEIYDELNKKQNKFETLTPLNLDIVTKGVVVPPLTYDTNKGGYTTSVAPTIYFDTDNIKNYNGNPQFFKDYGYIDIPYKVGQMACYSFSYGTSRQHAGMSAYNIVFGRWVGDDFDVIMTQGTGNNYLTVFPSYEVDSSGKISNPVWLTLNKNALINGSNYPSVYGGNQNIFQIINGRIYTYRAPYQGLCYVDIPADVLDRVLSITDILIIPYSANGQNRGYGIQPIYMSENSRVDGTMLFDSGNVAYPDLFPNATASTWNTLFETEFANKNILLQSSNKIEQLSLKYDNDTIKVNGDNKLYADFTPINNSISTIEGNLTELTALADTTEATLNALKTDYETNKTEVAEELTTLGNQINTVNTSVTELSTKVDSKQDKLTAGKGITIKDVYPDAVQNTYEANGVVVEDPSNFTSSSNVEASFVSKGLDTNRAYVMTIRVPALSTGRFCLGFTPDSSVSRIPNPPGFAIENKGSYTYRYGFLGANDNWREYTDKTYAQEPEYFDLRITRADTSNLVLLMECKSNLDNSWITISHNDTLIFGNYREFRTNIASVNAYAGFSLGNNSVDLTTFNFQYTPARDPYLEISSLVDNNTIKVNESGELYANLSNTLGMPDYDVGTNLTKDTIYQAEEDCFVYFRINGLKNNTPAAISIANNSAMDNALDTTFYDNGSLAFFTSIFVPKGWYYKITYGDVSWSRALVFKLKKNGV